MELKIHICMIKAITEIEDGFSKIEQFIKDYIELQKKDTDYHISEKISKAVQKRKIHKSIEDFYKKNKEFLYFLYERNYYYNITSRFYLRDNQMLDFLNILRNFGIDKLKKFVKQMEELDLKEFTYTDSDLKEKSYIMVNWSPISKITEFHTIMTDGNLFLLGRFYNEMYPYYLTNAKYVYKIYNRNMILNSLKINSFDINLPSYEDYRSAIENVPILDSKELYERTYFIRSLFELGNIKYNMEQKQNSIKNAKRKVEQDDILDDIIQMLDKQLNEIYDKLEKLEENAFKYGLNEELLEINMEHMRNCQRTSDNDFD